jgi:hypothetical protein
MPRSSSLSSSHYAASWRVPSGDDLNDRETVNRLAIVYANLPDGPEKEAKCLEIIQCFHGYLQKYLSMICNGHLPSLRTPAGKEASKILQMLIPKGRKVSRESLSMACRSMHLAFKQNTTDDIYDTLLICLMRAVRKYDPNYTRKVKKVCETIDAQFPAKRRSKIPVQFTDADISQQLGYDCLSYIRMLVKRRFLESVAGPKKKVVGYKRTSAWPPPEEFFKSGPIGFVYYLPRYFRYYLHEHICAAMGEIESDEGLLQLDYRPGVPGLDTVGPNIPHSEGDFTDCYGTRWAADVSLLKLPLDVSSMTLNWVQETSDKLFRKMTTRERYLLYLIYVQEKKWVEIAAILDCEADTARRQFDQIMAYLKGHATDRRSSTSG